MNEPEGEDSDDISTLVHGTPEMLSFLLRHQQPSSVESQEVQQASSQEVQQEPQDEPSEDEHPNFDIATSTMEK
jgi:transcription antitermination factor NusG